MIENAESSTLSTMDEPDFEDMDPKNKRDRESQDCSARKGKGNIAKKPKF